MPDPYTQVVRTVAGVDVQRVPVDAALDAAEGNLLLAGVSGRRLCVVAACLIAAGDVTATFYSGPADTGTALTGPLPLGTNGGFTLDAPTDPALAWLTTEPGQPLTLHLGSAVPVAGWLVYYEREA